MADESAKSSSLQYPRPPIHAGTTSSLDSNVNPSALNTGTVETRDGLRLHWVFWNPPVEARGTVLLIHGLGEHIGRYEHVASSLLGAGYAVLGFDMRGHGRSEGPRAYVSRFGRYVEDLDLLRRQILSACATRPLYLLGHSMGGLVALQYALHFGEEVDAVIAASPFIAPSIKVPRPLMAVASVLSLLVPKLPTLDISKIQMTHDPAHEAKKSRDSYGYRGRVRARTGYEMRQAGKEILRHAANLRHPLLLLHGTADPLTDWRGTCTVFGSAASDDKSIVLYNGMYHETMNEVGKRHVLDGINAWLQEHS